MQIKFNQLNHFLEKSLSPIYLIHGDEPVISQMAKDQIRKKAQQCDYALTMRQQIQSASDWDQIDQTLHHKNLFNDKQLIEIDAHSLKWEEKSTKLLARYVATSNLDKILIITTKKFTPAQLKTKWFQAIEKNSVVIPIWPLFPNEYQSWITCRLKEEGLQADYSCIQNLIYCSQGNLLAAEQTIRLLKILFPKQKITEEKMSQVLFDNSRHQIYDLMYSALAGDLSNVIRILASLKVDQTDPILINWVIAKELRYLISLHYKLNETNQLDILLAKEKPNRKEIIKKTLTRHSLAILLTMLMKCGSLDLMIKTSNGDVWMELSSLLVVLCRNTNLKAGPHHA